MTTIRVAQRLTKQAVAKSHGGFTCLEGRMAVLEDNVHALAGHLHGGHDQLPSERDSPPVT